MALTLTYFPTRSEAGSQLQAKLVPLIETLGFEVRIISPGTQADMMNACLRDDVVIFDATVEADPTQHNYAAATAMPTVMDHVLVISRTYLPINFFGLRSDTVSDDGAPIYPRSLDNQTIVTWVKAQLEQMLPHLPRPKNERGMWRMFTTMSHSLDREDERNHRGVFISYRSRHADGVRALTKRIERGDFAGIATNTRVLYGGELAADGEILTEQRRWQILSSLERLIFTCDELWIYETDDYYNSWWTQGEIIGAMYRGKGTPRIRIFDPKTGQLTDPAPDFLPQISQEQKRRMARWFANSDPAEMGPESLPAMRLYAQLPLIGRVKYFHDHVWSETFWEHPILDCPHCRDLGDTMDGLHAHLDDWLWTREEQGFFRLTPQEMQSCIETGTITCPQCHAQWRLREQPPRYMWYPIRVGRATGPNGSQIAALPTYVLGEQLRPPDQQQDSSPKRISRVKNTESAQKKQRRNQK